MELIRPRRVQKEQDQVGITDRFDCNCEHGPVQSVSRFEETGGIDKNDLNSVVRVMPRTLSRVVCALGVTMLSFSPNIAFMSDDLPTSGRPTSATNPALVSHPP